jgi:hypothetical protein
MKPGRIVAWAITAIAVPGLAACSGSSAAVASSPGQTCLAYLIPRRRLDPEGSVG